MAKIKGTIVVDVERCKGCSVCVSVCPVSCIELGAEVNGKGYNYMIMARADDCIGCAGCGMVCPDSVIEVYKQKFD